MAGWPRRPVRCATGTRWANRGEPQARCDWRFRSVAPPGQPCSVATTRGAARRWVCYGG